VPWASDATPDRNADSGSFLSGTRENEGHPQSHESPLVSAVRACATSASRPSKLRVRSRSRTARSLCVRARGAATSKTSTFYPLTPFRLSVTHDCVIGRTSAYSDAGSSLNRPVMNSSGSISATRWMVESVRILAGGHFFEPIPSMGQRRMNPHLASPGCSICQF
jgi:hypothetical protein